MSGWDTASIVYSDPITQQGDEETQRRTLKERFKDFLLNYREGQGFSYREQLKVQYNAQMDSVEVNLNHLAGYENGASLVEMIKSRPIDAVPLFESAAKEAIKQIMFEDDGERSNVRDIQVILTTPDIPSPMRNLKSQSMSKLVKVSGIIISASTTRAKATSLFLRCRNCQSTRRWPVNPGFGGAQLPRRCDRTPLSDDEERCPIDPYQIIPDKCDCIDQQTLKLQELPEDVPTGDMPRHMLLSVDRQLTDTVIPGTRCTVVGIFTVFSEKKERGSSTPSVRRPYLRVVGVEVSGAGPGRGQSLLNPQDEEKFQTLARDPEVYKKIYSSIAPSIFGADDMKKAIACLLFGGSTKVLPDSMRLRGDINVLLLGDPGTAKSQMLKFAEQVAPIGVYTSGKGSSAAGLTASVIRDASSREFYLEGGAMVLADGGVVCIDEFDKMRESDRVAIHEAMEQQTISIAKAGITTMLNSRTSVLAAANSVFGRWDDTKEADENIEFQSTILSRFDLIFIVKDEHNHERDAMLARHVMRVHLYAQAQETSSSSVELEIPFLKKYIHYCKGACGPRLSDAAVEKLKNHFVQIRNEAHKQYKETGKRPAIPITVRQLEALIRISEALAKMRCASFASETDVDEAIRLFKVSTMSAALSGDLSGAEGIADKHGMDLLLKIEKAIKRSFPIGSRVAEQRILERMSEKKYPEPSVRKVIHILLRRGELEYHFQRRVLFRVR
eukprot:m.45255 g.45255  ORF g.45255 m.45255 type:complete len:727 (+) comp7210_c0_seq2:40-2220(+)